MLKTNDKVHYFFPSDSEMLILTLKDLPRRSGFVIQNLLGSTYQLTSVGSEPTFWQAEPSSLIGRSKPSQAFFKKDKPS